MTSKEWVAGVDGAQKGWVVAFMPVRKSKGAYLKRYETFDQVKEATQEKNCLTIGVDMPIGLLEKPNQGIDSEIRERLGERRSSLFPTPSTAVLKAKTYEQALQLNKEAVGKGISIQAWNLLPQIRQVRESIDPEDTNRFFECHPETSFCELAKLPLSSKKTPEGSEQRINLLQAVIPDIATIVQALPMKCRIDDALDAFAAAWSAKRYAQNKAIIVGGYDYDNDGYPIRVII